MTELTVTAEAAPTRATRVTFFEDRAEVVRSAKIAIPEGISTVVLSGVSVAVDDPSLLARVSGDGARAVSARVVRAVKHDTQGDSAEIDAREADVRAARQRCAEVERTLVRAQAEQMRAGALGDRWMEAFQRVPREAASEVGRWRSAYDKVSEALTRALDRVNAQESLLEQCRLDLTRAHERVVAARAVSTRYDAAVEVQIESARAQECVVELTYRVPCALWRPEHQARLTESEGQRALTIRTWATAWQRTGETWRDVRCRFSTARPAQAAEAPAVHDDVLQLRRKSDAERRTVVVEARDQSVAITTSGGGARKVDEMPGVEDGGDALWFDARETATLVSDGQPVRMLVSEVELACTVDRVCWPERSPTVHIRARATMAGPTPLLAGPVALGRGTELVGRGKTGFVGRGEPLELGLGVDDGVRVRRATEERRETTPVLGTQKITRTVKLFVSNLSSAPRTLSVIERVPVSEVKEVEVFVSVPQGARHDARDGFITWELNLSADQTTELTLSYRIECGPRVVI